MSTRTYLSIGDVLTLLRSEFPDVTISKIRFLESQGLVSPQRSPSGYRKFYDEDVERLRFVLRQQRENFLPLKVIRDRLKDVEAESDDESQLQEETVSEERSDSELASGEPNTAEGSASSSRPSPSVSDVLAALQEAPAVAAPLADPPQRPAASPVAEVEPEVTHEAGELLTADELCAATGLDQRGLEELVGYGILTSQRVGGLHCFDAEAVAVATMAVGFARNGVEPRHLRQFRNSADREVGLVEQLVAPLLRQRNPAARLEAERRAEEISRLSRELRSALVAQELRRLFRR